MTADDSTTLRRRLAHRRERTRSAARRFGRCVGGPLSAAWLGMLVLSAGWLPAAHHQVHGPAHALSCSLSDHAPCPPTKEPKREPHRDKRCPICLHLATAPNAFVAPPSPAGMETTCLPELAGPIETVRPASLCLRALMARPPPRA